MQEPDNHQNLHWITQVLAQQTLVTTFVNMFLQVIPDYRVEWIVPLQQFQPTNEIIGYIALTLDGQRLSWGRTRTEAIVNGMTMLKKIQSSAIQEIRQLVEENPRKIVVTCKCEQFHHTHTVDDDFDRDIELIIAGKF